MVDLDAEIAAVAEMTIPGIFAQSGEAGFRLLETEQLRRFTSAGPKSGTIVSPLIVSLGGGAILREVNRAMIASSGPCVWLDADAATIVARLAEDAATGDQRPDLTGLPMGQEVQQLLETRKPLYEAVSELRIDTSTRSIQQICDEILSWLESRL